MPSTTTVVGGWTVVIGVIATWWYLNSKHGGRRTGHTKQLSKPLTLRKDVKSRRARPDDGQTVDDEDIKARDKTQRKRTQSGEHNRQGKLAPVSEAKFDDGDDELDNKEFARQLSSAKTGTLLPSRNSEGPRKKSIKQSRALENPTFPRNNSDNYEALSSVTGGDADDDQSFSNSPDLQATDMSAPVNNGDTSDMLEPPAPGPSILRITAPTNPGLPKKAKNPTTFEPVQTKKQRQNAKKAEARKSAREEDEIERKRLLEQQRRSAREAEGRPAKDGSIFMASQATSNNAWAKPASGDKVQGDRFDKHMDLLDTFGSSTTTTAPTSSNSKTMFDASISDAEASSNVDDNYSQSEIYGDEWAKLPSEEEQIQYSIEESKNWQLVQAKEKRNKKLKVASQGNGIQQESKDTTDTTDTTDSTDAEDTKETNDDTGTREDAGASVGAEHEIGESASEAEPEDYAPPKRLASSHPGQQWEFVVTYVEHGKVVEKTIIEQDSEWEVA